MTTGATEDFSQEEQRMLDNLVKQDIEEQAAAQGAASDAPGDPPETHPAAAPAPAPAAAPSPAPAALTTTPATDPAAALAAAAPAPQPQGDPRAALRAARRSERTAREEADRLRQENAELRAKVPAQVDPNTITDAELHELEQDMPVVAKAIKEVRALRPAEAPAPARAARQEFDPVPQPAEVQDVIDENPALLAWQNDPNQAAWKLAAQHDAVLRSSPAWTDKPMGERLAEATRRTQADLGHAAAAPAPAPSPSAAPAPAPATQRRDPAHAIKTAPRANPSTLSDIPSGSADTHAPPGLAQFMTMSDDEITDSLLRSTG